MVNEKFVISSAPHLRSEDTTKAIMHTVLLALVPIWVSATYFFGFNAIRLVVLSMAAAAAAELACQRLRKRPSTLGDGSALITGMLLGLSLPPTLPSWMAMLGSVVAIVLGKHVFGGLGCNPFNPALVGRAFLASSFVIPMTHWTRPFNAITTATPLEASSGSFVYSDLFFGGIPGSLGETSVLAILIGLGFLIVRGCLDYRIPIGFVGTVMVLTALLGQDPIFHLLAGSLLFGAIFFAVDPVTSPITPLGRWCFGCGAGIILVVIRIWGSLPEGVTYSILLMNACTPLFNRWTRSRVYGQGVKSNA